VYLLLDVGVVLGELDERTLAHQVHARGANLPDGVAFVGDDQGGNSSAHALLVRLLHRAAVDGPVGGSYGFADGAPGRFVLQGSGVAENSELTRDDLHRHGARYLTSRMPSHPVRDDKNATGRQAVCKEAVFVARSDHSNVRTGSKIGRAHV